MKKGFTLLVLLTLLLTLVGCSKVKVPPRADVDPTVSSEETPYLRYALAGTPPGAQMYVLQVADRVALTGDKSHQVTYLKADAPDVVAVKDAADKVLRALRDAKSDKESGTIIRLLSAHVREVRFNDKMDLAVLVLDETDNITDPGETYLVTLEDIATFYLAKEDGVWKVTSVDALGTNGVAAVPD